MADGLSSLALPQAPATPGVRSDGRDTAVSRTERYPGPPGAEAWGGGEMEEQTDWETQFAVGIGVVWQTVRQRRLGVPAGPWGAGIPIRDTASFAVPLGCSVSPPTAL